MAAHDTITGSLVSRIKKKLVKIKLQHGPRLERWPRRITTLLNRPGHHRIMVIINLSFLYASSFVKVQAVGSFTPDEHDYGWTLGSYYGHDGESKIQFRRRSRWAEFQQTSSAVVELHSRPDSPKYNQPLDGSCLVESILTAVADTVAIQLKRQGISDVYIKRNAPMMTEEERARTLLRMAIYERDEYISRSLDYKQKGSNSYVGKLTTLIEETRARIGETNESTGV